MKLSPTQIADLAIIADGQGYYVGAPKMPSLPRRRGLARLGLVRFVSTHGEHGVPRIHLTDMGWRMTSQHHPRFLDKTEKFI